MTRPLISTVDEPDLLIAWLKEKSIAKMDAVASFDVALAKRWLIIAEGLAQIEKDLAQ